jgi:Tol biopolymer transport system component
LQANQTYHPLRYLIIAFLILRSSMLFGQFYNGTQNEFGKNRIQYSKPEWNFLRFEKFDCYFYKNGKELATYVSETTHKNLKAIEEKLDFQLEDKIQIIVYNKYSDFKHSNIGLSSDAGFNIGGSTRINGSKIIIYYEGNHQLLDKQIKSGLAEVILNQMMYGGSWKDAVKNSALLNMPEWYTAGLISFLGGEWDAKLEYKVQDGVLTGKYKNLNRLTGTDAAIAGHAVWRYIAETYGIAVFPNILYMTRISRNIESGFSFVLGSNLKKLNKDFIEFYSLRFKEEEKNGIKPSLWEKQKKTKRNRVYGEVKKSPDGKFLAYTTNELGQVKLFIKNLETGKTKRIFKQGQKLDRIHDYSYPVVAWHPSSKLLAYTFEKKGEVNFSLYNVEDKKTDKRPPLFLFEKILDFSYSDDGKKIVLSAVQKGQTDIFVYTLASNYAEAITKDLEDDLNPRFIYNSQKIIFSSNRQDDTLRQNVKNNIGSSTNHQYDLFLYDYQGKSKLLKRVTETPDMDEFKVYPTSGNEFVYLAGSKGRFHPYLGKMDSTLAYVDTTEHYDFFSVNKRLGNANKSTIDIDIAKNTKQLTQLFYFDGRFRIAQTDIPAYDELSNNQIIKKSNGPNNASGNSQNAAGDPLVNIKKIEVKKVPVPEYNPAIWNEYKVNIQDYRFFNERSTTEITTTKIVPDTVSMRKVIGVESKPSETGLATPEFVIPKQRIYFRVFMTDQLVTQFDNNFLNPSYQKFTGSEVYFNPGLNGLVKIGLSDVFEDYRIVGGFRLSTDLKSNETFISYEDRALRWDKMLMFYRQSFPTSRTDFGAPKTISHQLKYGLKYPFNEVLSIRTSLTGRMDKTTYTAIDVANLREPNSFDYWGIGKVELVFDNTLSRGINLYYGTRFKIFGEFFNRLDDTEKKTYIIGVDYRRYIKIHRNLIWANRFAASTSFGPEKLVYYLGSVDNWLNFNSANPTFNRDIAIATDQNYAFQALASNLRGFSQNIRNGNSFALINSEIRWPIFNYLMNRPIKSDFINNFQLAVFGDIGSAWTGLTPYSKDNSFNTETIVSGPVTVYLKRQQNPVVGGYGWGMRSKVLGYFVRADWAWGVDDGEIQPRLFYLSLSLDF